VVGDDEVLVEHELLAEAVAGGAGALRRVEGEEARLDLGDGEAADRAGEFLGEGDAAGWGVVELHARLRLGAFDRVRGVEIDEAVGELQRGLEAVGEARLDPLADDDAVDHDLDVVLVLLVERGDFLDRVEHAVDADAGEAGLLPFGELPAVLALAAADDGGEEIMAAAFGKGHHPVDHLADLLRLDRKAGRGGIGHPNARPEEAHVV
jgi:hypothetical protein